MIAAGPSSSNEGNVLLICNTHCICAHWIQWKKWSLESRHEHTEVIPEMLKKAIGVKGLWGKEIRMEHRTEKNTMFTGSIKREDLGEEASDGHTFDASSLDPWRKSPLRKKDGHEDSLSM